MSLLGWPLLVLLGILTILLPAAAFWWWHRAPRRGGRIRTSLAGIALIIGSQLAAVAFVGAAVNDYGYFYSSWSEVLGAATQSAAITSHAAARDPAKPSDRSTPTGHSKPASAAQLETQPDPHWSTQAQWPTRGRLQSVIINGARSQLSSDALVYLPPQYFQPAFAHKTFPAILVLSGYPGSAASLVQRWKYPDLLLKEIQQGHAKPMVLVLMRPSVTYPRDTECTDVPAGPQALTFFAQDVPAAVTQGLRVRATGWGAIGDSTGGYCSVKIAMTHSITFSAAVALSGYFHTLKDYTTGDLWGGSAVVRNLNDLEWRLEHLPAPPISVLVTSSRDEAGPDGYVDTQKFIKLVKPPMKVDSLILPRGGHNFDSWAAELPQSIRWLSAKVEAGKPAR